MSTATAVEAVVAALRLTGTDDYGTATVAAAGLIPVILLPAYPSLIFALWRRRWILAASSLTLAVCHLAWTLPEVLPHDYTKSGGEPLTLLSQNILFTNDKSRGVAAEIDRYKPDVVLLLELSSTNLPPIQSALSKGHYSYSFVRPNEQGAFGFGVWSRYPLKNVKQLLVAGTPLLDAELEVGNKTVRLFGVHTVGPVNAAGRQRWSDELHWLAEHAVSTPDEQVIVAGDFNATRQHRDFRRLLNAGLRDAHDSGGGWNPTWPRTWWWLPPVLRIDHVLATKNVGVASQRVLGNQGSDHAGLLTSLQL